MWRGLCRRPTPNPSLSREGRRHEQGFHIVSAPVPGAAVAGAVEAARGYLRATGEDTAFERLARAAFSVGEAFTGVRFVSRADEEVLPVSARWTPLSAAPVVAIAGVTGLPDGGAPFVLPVGAYAVDIDGDGRGWVRVVDPGAATRVAVQFTAGLAQTWEALPPAVAQGVVALVAHLHDDRGGGAPPAAVGGAVAAVPAAAANAAGSMSARALVQAAVFARVAGVAGLHAFDAPPRRAGVPFAVVDEPELKPWGTKSWDGFEVRLSVRLWDEGERPARLRALLGAVEDAVADLAPSLGEGWRVVRVVLARSRVVGAPGNRWLAQAEFVGRIWREDG